MDLERSRNLNIGKNKIMSIIKKKDSNKIKLLKESKSMKLDFEIELTM